MLADTSNTRITVPSIRGRLTVACGRASATRMTASPSRKQSAGRWRRNPGPRLGRGLASAEQREVARHHPPSVLDAQVGEDHHGDDQQREQHRRPDKRHQSSALTSRPHGRARPGKSPGVGRAARCARPPPVHLLPYRRIPHDRPHQVLPGRERPRLHARPPERGVQLLLASPGEFGVLRPEARVVRVHVQLLARLRVLHPHRPHVRQLGLASGPTAAPPAPRAAG